MVARRRWSPGEIVLGYPDESAPTVSPIGSPLGEPVRWHSWEANGSYLVFMKLEQLAHEFRRAVRVQAEANNVSQDTLMARMLGRWRTGARLRPGQGTAAAPSWHQSEAPIPASAYLEDTNGTTVPLWSHIRKSNPRVLPSSDLPAQAREELDPSRHRLVRRSVSYGKKLPDGQETWDNVHRGILFACYQADIARQFEHVMGKWLTSPDFRRGAGSSPCRARSADRRHAHDPTYPRPREQHVPPQRQ